MRKLFASLFRPGLAVLAAVAAAVFLAPGAAHADGPIVAQYPSQALVNVNADTCPNWPGPGITIVLTDPCPDPSFYHLVSALSQTTTAPARIPGHVYHQLAITPPGGRLSPGDPATYCLDVPDRNSGSLVTVTPCAWVTGGQFWTPVRRPGGFIYANLASGKCLAQVVLDQSGLTNSGDVIQTDCDNSDALWANDIMTTG
jgi:hypothetical protein